MCDRRIVESYTSNARFVLCCNYVNKIIPALQVCCCTFTTSVCCRTHICHIIIHTYVTSSYTHMSHHHTLLQLVCVAGLFHS